MTDGYIAEAPRSKKNKTKVPTALVFCSKDLELVQYVKSELQATYPITEPKANFFRLSISNRRFAAELTRFGLIPRKNTGLTTYPGMPGQFDRDFIQGVFDGDGWVRIFTRRWWKRRTLSTGQNQVIEIGWAGSNRLMQKIAGKLTMHLGLPSRNLYPRYNGITFDLRYGAERDCLAIFKFLYPPDCCMRLERKYTKAAKFFREKELL